MSNFVLNLAARRALEKNHCVCCQLCLRTFLLRAVGEERQPGKRTATAGEIAGGARRRNRRGDQSGAAAAVSRVARWIVGAGARQESGSLRGGAIQPGLGRT